MRAETEVRCGLFEHGDTRVYYEAKGASHPVRHEQPAWLVETMIAWLLAR